MPPRRTQSGSTLRNCCLVPVFAFCRGRPVKLLPSAVYVGCDMATMLPMTQHVTSPRVVVIGAGFAGINAAKALAGANMDVTVVDRKNHHTFQPLLYQVALAVLSP